MSDEASPVFDPVECANLHNQLVERAVQANPSLRPVRNLLRNHGDDSPLRTRLTPRLQKFLTLIDGWEVTADEETALTPLCQPPSPKRFFMYNNRYPFKDHGDDYVLLYQDAQLTIVNEGGLFFDQDIEGAYWIDADHGKIPKGWQRLDRILRLWLMMWDVGKFKPLMDLELRPWGTWELDQALDAWNRLLKAIEDRLPDGDNRISSNENANQHTVLVEQSVTDRWGDHSFEKAFLSRARAPKVPGLQVAPGVKTWTTETYSAIHANEPEDSERRQAIGIRVIPGFSPIHPRANDSAPALLFPCDATVTRTTGIHNGIDDFVGRGSALLNRKAGLYLDPDENWGDAVLFIDCRGDKQLFTYQTGLCPWMPIRPMATLREVLSFWMALVEDGIWQVDEHGVTGTIDYFDDLENTTKMVRMNGTEIAVNFRATWNIAPAF